MIVLLVVDLLFVRALVYENLSKSATHECTVVEFSRVT